MAENNTSKIVSSYVIILVLSGIINNGSNRANWRICQSSVENAWTLGLKDNRVGVRPNFLVNNGETDIGERLGQVGSKVYRKTARLLFRGLWVTKEDGKRSKVSVRVTYSSLLRIIKGDVSYINSPTWRLYVLDWGGKTFNFRHLASKTFLKMDANFALVGTQIVNIFSINLYMKKAKAIRGNNDAWAGGCEGINIISHGTFYGREIYKKGLNFEHFSTTGGNQ